MAGFNKQGNLHTQLVLGAGKMNRSPHPCSGILRVYTEAFSHVDSLDGLNITSVSQDQILKNLFWGYFPQVLWQGADSNPGSADLKYFRQTRQTPPSEIKISDTEPGVLQPSSVCPGSRA